MTPRIDLPIAPAHPAMAPAPAHHAATPARLAALVALGLPLGFLALLVTAASAGNVWAVGATVTAIALALYVCDRLATAAALRLGSARLPWALWASVTLSFWVAAAALIEIGALFSATDGGGTTPAFVVPIMVATGIIGVLSATASAVIAVRLATRLNNPHTAVRVA